MSDAMPGESARARVPRRALRAWIALACLHLATSARFPWQEEYSAWYLLRPNPDGLGLLALGCLLAWMTWLPPIARRIAEHALTLLLLSVPAFRCLDSLMVVFHGREVDFFNDAFLLPGLVHLLAPSDSVALQALLAGLALLGLVGLHVVALELLRSFLSAAESARFRIRFLGATAVLATAGGLLGFAQRSLWVEPLLPTLAARVAQIHDRWQESRTFSALLEKTESEVAACPQDLGLLAGHDVFLLFVESYGRSLFRTPRTSNAFEAWAGAWESELAAEGISVVSAAAYPSIRGGASSLAHAELLCGVQVPNYRTFERLLESPLTPLPRLLSRAGHRSYNVQPATYREWPEGAFFGFDEDVFLDDFPYAGHEYHWGTMPDQFALAHLLQHTVLPSAEPVFVQYVSVTSHATFHSIPPYYDDWQQALEAGAFEDEPEKTYPIHWGNYLGHPELEQAYMDVIRYSFQCFLDFTERLPRPALVILMGDHQPPGLTSLEANDLSHDVPIHVLSRDSALLEPFRAAGFRDGLVPSADFEAFSTSQFLTRFLRSFSAN